jgi:molybdenum cofactor synthesis domain-containing protein
MTAPSADAAPTAAILLIGNEILSGRTHDKNLPYIAEKLTAHGVRVREARVIADQPAAIVAAVNACRATYDYVLTTGGIGPTHDDITSLCIAEAFGSPLHADPEAVARLTAHYGAENLNSARLKMAEVPAGASLIDNPVSAAPGFRIGNVFVMAGVPRIMQAMLDHVLRQIQGGPPVLSATVSCLLGEGTIAAALTAVQNRFADVEIGSYPYFQNGRFGVSLVARTVDAERLAATVIALETMIAELEAQHSHAVPHPRS